ncbi:ABC transporter permease [Candidatus Epulonipiscium fishelsonii]|uniref:ABC transporter permease n=1 Tax=Candidatus Epulonipiscium fishelsonii TaxID=77094 RepID=A0ACC8XBC0_9FIRM|nr:ABC transporter permease [Epulopiscium sp. SCG-B05WGA-EpuloA1]ONI39713.1 ABC transporter permease [Epulopiscium sp. SCG-B11WGA-EpuloA1]
MKKEGSKAYLFLAPYIVLFSMFILIPVIVAMFLSFTYFDVINTPKFVGFSNYIAIFTQDEAFMKYVIPNTILFGLVVGVFGYVLSFILAWSLSQIQRVPRTVLALAIYTPSMLGQVFIGVVWKTIFSGDQNGILNSLLLELQLINIPIQFLLSPDYLMPIMIIVALWSSMGIGFLAMLSGVMNISSEQYEAAYVDGMRNRFQEIIYITIPNMKPQMLFGAVMSITGAFNMGYIGVTLSGSNPTPSYAGQLITNHIDDFAFLRYEMGYAAAMSVVLLVVVYSINQIAYKLFGE